MDPIAANSQPYGQETARGMGTKPEGGYGPCYRAERCYDVFLGLHPLRPPSRKHSSPPPSVEERKAAAGGLFSCRQAADSRLSSIMDCTSRRAKSSGKTMPPCGALSSCRMCRRSRRSPRSGASGWTQTCELNRQLDNANVSGSPLPFSYVQLRSRRWTRLSRRRSRPTSCR